MRVDNSVILFIVLLPSWWWLFIAKTQNDFRSKVQKHVASFLCWNNFLAPNGAAPAWGATSANQNVDHVRAPGNALSTDQKHSLSSQPIPKRQLWALYWLPGSFWPQTRLTMWSQPIRYFLLFSSLCFILYPIKASSLPFHCTVLQMETSHVSKC